MKIDISKVRPGGCDFRKHDPEIFKDNLLDIVEYSKKTKVFNYDGRKQRLLCGHFFMVR